MFPLAGGIIVLILAIKGTTDFKERQVICKDIGYAYQVEGDKSVYLAMKDTKEYLTKFKSTEEFADEYDTQCGDIDASKQTSRPR